MINRSTTVLMVVEKGVPICVALIISSNKAEDVIPGTVSRLSMNIDSCAQGSLMNRIECQTGLLLQCHILIRQIPTYEYIEAPVFG